jgi:hypothetical protein
VTNPLEDAVTDVASRTSDTEKVAPPRTWAVDPDSGMNHPDAAAVTFTARPEEEAE